MVPEISGIASCGAGSVTTFFSISRLQAKTGIRGVGMFECLLVYMACMGNNTVIVQRSTRVAVLHRNKLRTVKSKVFLTLYPEWN